MIETATLEGTFGGQAGGDSAVRYLVLAMQSTHPHESPARFELDGRIKTVIIGRGTSRTTVRSADMSELRVDVPDRRMSGRHAILRWSRGRFALEDAGSKNGIRVNNVRTEGATLADGDVIELGSTYFVYRDVRVSEEELKARSGSPSQPGHVLSTMCLPLELRFRVMKRVAAADVPVMVRGETGTGKELVARAIHQASARTGAFVPANCGAIAANLVESELFGH